MTLTFDTFGNEKQKEACRAWADPTITDVGYGGGKYGGKSYLGATLIFGDALTYPGTHYAIARVELKALENFTLPTIYEVFEAWGLDERYYSYNGQKNYFQLYNGSRVYLVDVKYKPSDPLYARFGSMQFTRVWGEEIGEWHPLAKANLHITVGRWRNQEYNLTGKGLYTFNPSRNFTYTDYYKPSVEGTLPPYRTFIKALPTDNKRANPEVLENMRQTLTNAEYRRLFLGEWEAGADANCLVSYDAVCDTFTNTFAQVDESPAARILSTDIATRGRDRWVVWEWEGDRVTLRASEGKTTARRIQEELERIATRRQVARSRIVSDADGVGDYLESYMPGLYEFKGGARPIETASLPPSRGVPRVEPPKYTNLKAQCAWELARLIESRRLHIVIGPELAQHRTEIIDTIKDELMLLIAHDATTEATTRRIIDKEDMKQRNGGKSPDYLDGLIMGVALRLTPIRRGIRRASKT